MTELREDPRRAVIIGAGRGGSAIVEMLLEEELVEVVGVVDVNPDAVGMALARKHGISTFDNVVDALKASAPCVAFNMTGNEMVEAVASDILGAGGIIGGMEAKLIWRMVTNLKTAKEELRIQASHDALTGLYNRRHGMQQLQIGLRQAVRYNYPFSLVMLDVDNFKSVNDTFGHVAGDAVLYDLANVLRENLRESDVPCRWGGEEFLVLLPHTDRHGAARAAHNWLENVKDHAVELTGGECVSISFSAGVASFESMAQEAEADQLAEALLHEADRSMYQAKENGRSCVYLMNEAFSGESS